jgi:diadenosine tetraphosphate (Ap4A) HIT family hydrolase
LIRCFSQITQGKKGAAIYGSEGECPFCTLVEDGVSPVWRYLFPTATGGEVLWTSDLFTVALDTAPLVEGHLLVISNNHVTSLASIVQDANVPLRQAISTAEELVSRAYGDFTYFEHGAMSFARHAGACVDHAHLHIVPGRYYILPDIARDYPDVTCYPNYEAALRHFARTPYLVFGASDIGAYGVSAPVCATQYLRRLISRRANVVDKWSWRDCIRQADSLHLREQLERTRSMLLDEID